MKRFNQLKYTTETLGDTEILLRRYGCLVCSICSGWSRMYPKGKLLPEVASKLWDFTNNGLLYWSSNFDGMDFIARYRNETPTTDTLAHWVRTKERIVLLEVDWSHWVVCYYYPITGWTRGLVIIDPLGGKIRPLWATKYKITGYALFKKKGSL